MSASKTNALDELIHATAIAAVDTIVLAIDDSDGVILLNPAGAKLLSPDAEHFIGRPAAELLGDEPPKIPDQDQDVIYRLTATDEQEQRLRGRWSVVEGHEGIRLLIAKDDTQAHNLGRDLVRSAALAELGLMAAEVAHEVNNPATYLLANLSILRDDLAAGALDIDNASELVDECLDGVTRITDVVKRMRTLASSSEEEIGENLVNLSTVVRDACRIAGLRVRYRADLHIHDDTTVLVVGSPKRLGQVVLNLVINAADALTGQAEPLPRIDVSVSSEDGFGVVSVRDNGPGIPKEKHASIFTPFVTSKSNSGGTGLGLAVSRTIAEEHAGTLSLTPNSNLGAWFKLRIPLP